MKGWGKPVKANLKRARKHAKEAMKADSQEAVTREIERARSALLDADTALSDWNREYWKRQE